LVLSAAWPFVLLGLGLLGVGLTFWRPIPAGVWHDDGVYVLIGKALAAGEGLTYAGVPGSPPAVKFPPGYPMVLAALWALFGSIGPVTLAAEVLNLMLLSTAGALLALALHKGAGLGRGVAVAASGLAFASADVWRPALVPLSEPMFIALVAAAMAMWPGARRPHDKRSLAWLTVFLVAAVLTRSAGIAVVAGFAVSMALARGVRAASVLSLPPVMTMMGWSVFAAGRASRIPEGLDDVLGPYGGWLADQVAGSPVAFVVGVPAHGFEVVRRVAALLLPGLDGWTLAVAAAPVLALAVFGGVTLARRFPPLIWVSLAYVGMLLVWPFVDRRLVAPLHPWVVSAVVVGIVELVRDHRPRSVRRTVGALAFLWVGAYAVVTGGRAGRGWAVAGYELRAGRLAAAVETLQQTAPPEAVVGAPEFWAAIHLHGGWRTIPSALFTPRSEDTTRPVWGSPEEQLRLWRASGVDHVLLEQGGQIHGEALNLLEERCPGSVGILARMPPQILVRLDWSDSCQVGAG
jgi:hypothetical protein